MAVWGQGVPPEWNVRAQLDELKSRFAAISPALEKVNLQRWKDEGVASAYLDQFTNIQTQLKSLSLAIADLRQTPEKLSVALEIFLRFDSLDAMQRAVMEAVRKYEAPELSEEIEARFVESAPARNQFRTYLLDLAALRDSEHAVLQHEAERCRVEKNAPAPPPVPKPVVKKK
jgi:5'-3' exonuclease